MGLGLVTWRSKRVFLSLMSQWSTAPTFLCLANVRTVPNLQKSRFTRPIRKKSREEVVKTHCTAWETDEVFEALEMAEDLRKKVRGSTQYKN